jgi:hypothetical protein
LTSDVKALKDVSEGGYGWTHWDNCIGQPAGFIPQYETAELETTKVCGGEGGGRLSRRLSFACEHAVSACWQLPLHPSCCVADTLARGNLASPRLALLAQGATLSQKHGVTVEHVEMKHRHKEVVKDVIGRSTADLTPSESKKLAIKKAVAEAVHKVRAVLPQTKSYERFVRVACHATATGCRAS